MISRRTFLAALLASPALARRLGATTDTLAAATDPATTTSATPAATAGEWVNDIHSALNRTQVATILKPDTPKAVTEAILRARDTRRPISICGARHAMGAQQFGTDTTLLDMTALNRPVDMTMAGPYLEVEAGMTWPELVRAMRGSHTDPLTPPPTMRWAICQKQTGADNLTLGGAVAANIHGRGLRLCPIAADIQALSIIDANGETRRIDGNRDPELFRLVTGGYGLFGIVTSVHLRLTRLILFRRDVTLLDADEVIPEFERRIAADHMYGDFQFEIDPKSDGFLTRGIMSTYERLHRGPDRVPPGQKTLGPDEWRELVALSHADKAAAYQRYVSHYLTTNGQLYWGDLSQLGGGYAPGYHTALDKGKTPGSEMISELYVPRPRLADFLHALAETFRARNANVIYGTVRLIVQDQQSFLAWAKQSYACVVINLHVDHTPDGIAKARDDFRAAIDLALDRDGSFYLTYHKWATKEQILRAYPQFPEFLSLKKKYDPDEIFQSDWYRHHRDLLA